MTLMAANAPRSVVLNCGSGKASSFNEVIQALNEALGTQLEPEYIDNPYNFYQPHTQADMGRAKEVLGFVPAHTPREGILAYIQWLESQG
jgi:ADP-L-glycero-D-manno-heptose 6-epimerase